MWDPNSAVTLAAFLAWLLGSWCALADACFTRFSLSIVFPTSLFYLLSVSLCADIIQGKEPCQAQWSPDSWIPGSWASLLCEGELSQSSGAFAAAQAPWDSFTSGPGGSEDTWAGEISGFHFQPQEIFSLIYKEYLMVK